MTTDDEMITAIRALCAEQYIAVLCTQYQGQPFGNLVAFAISDDYRYLCFPTDRNTRKFRNLDADPRVALLIDSRHGYPDDLRDAHALTVSGRVVMPDDTVQSSLRATFLVRHPQFHAFMALPTTVLMVIMAAQYDLVSDFEQVRTLTL